MMVQVLGVIFLKSVAKVNMSFLKCMIGFYNLYFSFAFFPRYW